MDNICITNPNWIKVDCDCCGGIKWGGEEPIECKQCRGNGYYCVHIKTGTMALYPGGPLLGKYNKSELIELQKISLEPEKKNK